MRPEVVQRDTGRNERTLLLWISSRIYLMISRWMLKSYGNRWFVTFCAVHTRRQTARLYQLVSVWIELPVQIGLLENQQQGELRLFHCEGFLQYI